MRAITKIIMTLLKAVVITYKLTQTKSRNALLKKELVKLEKSILNWS